MFKNIGLKIIAFLSFILLIIILVAAYCFGDIRLLIESVSSILGAVLGVIGAYYVFTKQLEAEKEKIDNDKKPNLIATETFFQNISLRYSKIHGLNESKYFIPLVNAGITPVYDINYEYQIDDLESNSKQYNLLFSRLEKEGRYPRMELGYEDIEAQYNIDLTEYNHTKEDSFSLIPQSENQDNKTTELSNLEPVIYIYDKGSESKGFYKFPIKRNNKYTSALIMPGETLKLEIPDHIIHILKYQMRYGLQISQIKVEVTFKDYQHDNGKIYFNFKPHNITINVNSEKVNFYLKTKNKSFKKHSRETTNY